MGEEERGGRSTYHYYRMYRQYISEQEINIGLFQCCNPYSYCRVLPYIYKQEGWLRHNPTHILLFSTWYQSRKTLKILNLLLSQPATFTSLTASNLLLQQIIKPTSLTAGNLLLRQINLLLLQHIHLLPLQHNLSSSMEQPPHTSSSSAAPAVQSSSPARSSHPMTLRPRQQTWLLPLPPPLPPHGYCILLLLSPLHFLMLTAGMQFGIMLCVMRSLLCAQIALGLWFRFILL